MTRNLPEPRPEIAARGEPGGKNKVHAAVDAALDQAICRSMTGKVIVSVDLNEGGVRAVKITSEEIFRTPS